MSDDERLAEQEPLVHEYERAVLEPVRRPRSAATSTT